MEIIGLSGYAQVGKDTAARILQLEGWTRFAFADVLKKEIAPFLRAQYQYDPLVPMAPEMHAEWAARKGVMRPLLVAHGAVRRAIDPDYWINQVRKAIRECEATKVVITDVRYRNEAEWVRAEGGHVVVITRPNYMPANDEEAASIADMKKSLKGRYWVVENDASPLEMGAAILRAINSQSRPR